MPSPDPSENRIAYCAAQVRTYDYHRYFAAAHAPADVRRGLIALYAFNLEIAAIRERVSEALLGQMRLQWWRDTIDGIYAGEARNHAVVGELAHAIETFDLSRAGLDRMIDGRLFDLEDEPPEDMNALKRYVAATSGALTGLAAEICGQREFGAEAEAAGSFWGMAGLLRALPHQAAQNRIYLPKDRLRAEGVAREEVIERKAGKNLAPVIESLAYTAEEMLPRNIRYPKPLRPAVAYTAIARSYLRRVRRSGFDVYGERLEPSRFAAQLSILRCGMTGRV